MKSRDLLIVIIWPLCIFLGVFLFDLQINYFESILLVFGIPSLYLSWRNRVVVKNILKFSLLVSIPIAFIFELVAHGDSSWLVPASVFPLKN